MATYLQYCSTTCCLIIIIYVIFLVIRKLWSFLKVYVLTVNRFDLFLQGALLIVILLQHNVNLLLKRDGSTGYTTPLIGSWTKVGTGVVEFLFGAFIAWWGRGRRNLALSAWLAVTAFAGLIVMAFPFARPNPPSVELCGGEQISVLVQKLDPLAVPRTVFLIMTAVMCSLAKVSIYAHGFTILDDQEPQNGPYFYGILVSIQLSLGLSGENWLRAGSAKGDWWHAHLSICMLTLMFAVLFTLFPKRVTKSSREESVDDPCFIATLRRLFCNRGIMLQVGALGFLNAALFGFFFYDRQYMEARYHVETKHEDLRSSPLATNLYRPLVIIFFVMIFRVRFSVRRSDAVKSTTASRVGGVVALVVAVFFVVLAVLQCDRDELVGMKDGELETLSCSQECGCDRAAQGFTPVCALESSTTYYSPCDAGCREFEDLNGFLVLSNCTCEIGRLVRGACALPRCQFVFYVYQALVTVVLAVSGASMLMQGMSVARATGRSDKPTAMGVLSAIVALTGQALGTLLYLLISSLTCALYNGRQCIFHQPSMLAMPAVSAALALLSAIASILASRVQPVTTARELNNTTVIDTRTEF